MAWNLCHVLCNIIKNWYSKKIKKFASLFGRKYTFSLAAILEMKICDKRVNIKLANEKFQSGCNSCLSLVPILSKCYASSSHFVDNLQISNFLCFLIFSKKVFVNKYFRGHSSVNDLGLIKNQYYSISASTVWDFAHFHSHDILKLLTIFSWCPWFSYSDAPRKC